MSPTSPAGDRPACCDRQAVVDALTRYATCLDRRDWAGLAEVFTAGAVGDYGGFEVEGLEALQAWCRRLLGGCGPSQHLLGQTTVVLDDGTASAETEARVIHVGAGERAGLTPYETIGTYHDRLVRTPAGWRIAHRRFDVRIQLGDPAVLAPE